MKSRQKPQAHFSGVRKKIAILTFFNESPYGGKDLAITATEELKKELGRTGEFIIDFSAKKMFNSSKEIYSGGGLKLVQMSRQAKMAGLNLVIFGRIIDARIRQKSDEIGFIRKIKYYAEGTIEIKVFDINESKEIFTDIIKSYVDDVRYQFFSKSRNDHLAYRRSLFRYTMKVAVKKVIRKILDVSAKLDWVGRVAKVIGDKVYINAGRDSGINIGDILKVVTEGQEIYDPETGALIGISKGYSKATIEVVDYFSNDGSLGVLHSGGRILEGDYVELY